MGQYALAQRAKQIRVRKLEIRKNRIAITPFLQAEQDYFYRNDKQRWQAFEKEVMSSVEGWEVGESPYQTAWVPPAANPSY